MVSRSLTRVKFRVKFGVKIRGSEGVARNEANMSGHLGNFKLNFISKKATILGGSEYKTKTVHLILDKGQKSRN